MKRTAWKIKRYWKFNIAERLEHFFYDHCGNGVCGPGYESYREFKYGKLAFTISILTLLGFILYIILT